MKEKLCWLGAKSVSVQRKSGRFAGSTGFLVKVVLLRGWRAQEPPLQPRGCVLESHRMFGTVGATGQRARSFHFEVCLSGRSSWWESYILHHLSPSETSPTCFFPIYITPNSRNFTLKLDFSWLFRWCLYCPIVPFNSGDKERLICDKMFSFLFLQASSQCTTAMLTSERSPQSTGVTTAAMPRTRDVDMTSWSETDFEKKCTYIVKDQPLDEDSKNHRKTRAERSLPRNLALKRCHNSEEVGSKVNLCQDETVQSGSFNWNHYAFSVDRHSVVVYVLCNCVTPCVTPTSFHPLVYS